MPLAIRDAPVTGSLLPNISKLVGAGKIADLVTLKSDPLESPKHGRHQLFSQRGHPSKFNEPPNAHWKGFFLDAPGFLCLLIGFTSQPGLICL